MNSHRFQCVWLFVPLAHAFVTVSATFPSAARAEESAGADEPATKTTLTQADREAIAWFDSLDFPDLAGKKCVRVATGYSVTYGDNPPTNRYRLAFLLDDRGGNFTVFELNLSTNTYEKTPAATPDSRRVGYEVLDLKEVAAAHLALLRKPQDRDDHSQRFGGRLDERSEVFVLARGCAANGHDQAVHELIAEAAKLRSWDSDDSPGAKGFVEALSAEIAHNRMWEAVEAFGDPSIGRKELLSDFQYVVKHFPESKHADRAKTTAKLLKQMVEEDESRAREKRKPLDEMTIEEQVAELIFRLRDQNGHQLFQPGGCDIFNDRRGEESPAHQLVKIGFDAVPQLIEVVDDRRFTRSVGFHRDFYFSHYVLRVGDSAQRIIERIASRRFYMRTDTNAATIKEGEESEVKKRIKAWWADTEHKGEKQVLIEAVEAADRNAVWQARRLLKAYPDDALAPIARAAGSAKESYVRGRLTEMLGEIPGDAPVPFLLEQLKKGPELWNRLAAAKCLLERRRPEAIPAMIAEWRRVTQAAAGKLAGEGPITAYYVEDLIGFLAGCGDAAAIRALGDGLSHHTVSVRLTAVSVFGSSSMLNVVSSGSGGGINTEKADEVTKQEVSDAIEEFLVAALADTDEREGVSGSWDGKSLTDPRICDIAGHVLAQRLPEKYTFDLDATLWDRDRQRIAAINIRRKERNQPLIKVLEPKRIEPLPPETTSPLIAGIIDAPSAKDRDRAIEEIERLGLPALPAVRKRLAKLDKMHPAHAELGALACRLATIVDEVVFADDSAKPNEAVTRRLDAVKGKPLTSKAFVGILLAVTNDLPLGATGVKLRALRRGNDGGVKLEIRLTKSGYEGGAWISGGSWGTSERITVGRRRIHSSPGAWSHDLAQSENAYETLARAIDEAVAAPLDESFIIAVSRIEDRRGDPFE